MAGCNNAIIDSTCLVVRPCSPPRYQETSLGLSPLPRTNRQQNGGKSWLPVFLLWRKVVLNCFVWRDLMWSSFSQSKRKISMESVPFENALRALKVDFHCAMWRRLLKNKSRCFFKSTNFHLFWVIFWDLVWFDDSFFWRRRSTVARSSMRWKA